MFQSYEVRTSPDQGTRHLPLLRVELQRRGLDGFIVPHEDEYQNEYIPAALDRLCWLTGFTGSAGAAVALMDKAAIFVDGRYTLQVRAQVDCGLFAPHDLKPGAAANWIAANAPVGARIGYDPWLHTIEAVDAMSARLEAAGMHLAALPDNPVDAAWTDRPQEPLAPVYPHPQTLSGRTSAEKRADIAKELKADGADAAILTHPASVAWAFNIRGGDVAHTPLPLSRAILYTDEKADLFLDPRKVSDDLAAHLGPDVRLRPISAFVGTLSGLKDKTVRADPAGAPAAVFKTLEAAGAKCLRRPDPCIHPRARKNTVEIAGTRAAHARDGAALTRFLRWLDAEAPKGSVTEIKAAETLETFRRQTNQLKDVSFETISGAGPNGAIVHYRVTTATDRALGPGELYLVDSGAQYLDGTTDVTRTIAIGAPSEEMQRAFTCVLKGHIALATARFPEGTCGVHLDALARLALWKAGLDFDHGTGHGVGSYLGVHEGPQNISKALRNEPLLPGMIVSNEPGYYKTGAYGIRLENLVLVTEPEIPEGGERPMLGFETLTLAPFDRGLIITGMLTLEETDWLNAYHARVRAVVGDQLDPAERAWLDAAAAPL